MCTSVGPRGLLGRVSALSLLHSPSLRLVRFLRGCLRFTYARSYEQSGARIRHAAVPTQEAWNRVSTMISVDQSEFHPIHSGDYS